MKIIFALGNPGPDYANTRHNIGFSLLNALADQLDAKWSNQPKFNAITTDIIINEEKVILAKPTTFYNESGMSARKIIDFYKLDSTANFLVIHDDLSLLFGTIRVRGQGRDAGNNGIKSLNTHIGPDYTRIRIGTSNDLREHMNDADFVLSKFKADELEQISKTIIPQAIESINKFCTGALQPTSHKTL